jgi:hypothetical protein
MPYGVHVQLLVVAKTDTNSCERRTRDEWPTNDQQHALTLETARAVENLRPLLNDVFEPQTLLSSPNGEVSVKWNHLAKR